MGVPLLGWEPPPLSRNIYATQVMSTPVVTFSSVEKVGRIVDILTNERYNGFPVVEIPMFNDGVSFIFISARNKKNTNNFIIRRERLAKLGE